ncbi:hypothetical protein A9Q99_20150 [Gammaproteobacteria bacterium 45_16_T64]|nr:hypothetical protein A9Q99_20150 [Gammaproteobacteria bacterium 45_16_T64]
MEPILFLTHRIPFPPNKGDKIRSFNILKWLSKHYEVHLGCFVDDVDDRKYVSELGKYCKSYKAVNLNPMLSKVKSLKALFFGKPLTLPYYESEELRRWVESTIGEHDIELSLMFSSSMAQYLESQCYGVNQRVLDMIDVDSDKWKQYSEKASFPMSWVYSREFRTLAEYEKKIVSKFDAVALVSHEEAELLRSMVGGDLKRKVHDVCNGVDSEFFDPQNEYEKLGLPKKMVSFTGVMDYWANVESVVWFCRYVWPEVVKKHPDACFYIVGTSPSSDVLALNDGVNVVVTGRVSDVRPYIESSSVVVAPLRIARGVQNKVLEALSMEKAVFGTSMAFEGIDYTGHELDILIEDNEANFSEALISQFDLDKQNTKASVSKRNRDFVIGNYNWNAKLNALQPLLQRDIKLGYVGGDAK